MKKQRILLASGLFFLSILFGCKLFTRKVHYKGEEYTIEISEFGVVFVNQFDGVEYYMNDTVYKCGENFYCLISGSQDKGKRWIFIQEDKALDIDSAKANFTLLCQKTLKKEILN